MVIVIIVVFIVLLNICVYILINIPAIKRTATFRITMINIVIIFKIHSTVIIRNIVCWFTNSIVVACGACSTSVINFISNISICVSISVSIIHNK